MRSQKSWTRLSDSTTTMTFLPPISFSWLWFYKDFLAHLIKPVFISVDNFVCVCVYFSRVCCCSVNSNSINCNMPGFPVLHYLPEFTQTHVNWIDHAIQPVHPLSPPSPSACNLSLYQSLFQWVSFSHQVTKVFELQFQYESFWWIFRVDFL